jgi:hypothetical protein
LRVRQGDATPRYRQPSGAIMDLQVEKYISGLTNPELPQADSKGHDPQRAVLNEFLAEKRDLLGPGKSIVDFGSGAGSLTRRIEEIWGDLPAPKYIAVDLQNMLDTLSMSVRIHNNSMKMTVQDFYAGGCERISTDVAILVIRGVLHELDIEEFVQLLKCIGGQLTAATTVYVQDRESFAKAEAGRAAWHGDLVRTCFDIAGFTARVIPHTAFGGTKWYTIVATRREVTVEVSSLLRTVIGARKTQLERLHERLELVEPSNLYEFTHLRFDIAEISRQLRHAQRIDVEVDHSTLQVGDTLLRIQSGDRKGNLQYARELDEETRSVTGVVAILAHKRMVDLPHLFSSATKRIFFCGYSHRSIFRQESILGALSAALAREVNVRLLFVDPNSQAAALRAAEPAYEHSSSLLEDIVEAIGTAAEFRRQLIEAVQQRFEIALSVRAPCAAYFIVDELCIVSLYGPEVTGSGGPSLVLTGECASPSNLFRFLSADFELSWLQSRPQPLVTSV